MTYSDYYPCTPGCKDEYEQSISDYYYSLGEGWEDEEIKRREELQEELQEEERRDKERTN